MKQISQAPLFYAAALLAATIGLAYWGAGFMPQAFQQPFLLTALAGLATGIGSLIFLTLKQQNNRHLVFSLGLSAGAMLYVSFAELLQSAVETIGFLVANSCFLLGFVVMWVIDNFLPHQYLAEKHLAPERGRLLSTAKLVAVGIAIHNLPEGMAVFISSAANHQLGLGLAIAIAVHNIPEGIAVAAPVYHATGDRFKAFLWSYLSGVAEPLGAILALWLLQPYLSETFTAYCFAAVAGVMTFISFDELLPSALKYPELHQTAIFGLGLGITLLMLSLMPL